MREQGGKELAGEAGRHQGDQQAAQRCCLDLDISDPPGRSLDHKGLSPLEHIAPQHEGDQQQGPRQVGGI